MKTAEVITQGTVQSIRLPEDVRIEDTEVFVKRVGRSVLLIPVSADRWQILADSLEQFTSDYMEDRAQPTSQDRETVFE